MNVRTETAESAATRVPRDGFEVRRGAVGPQLVDDVLRLLHLDLLTRGAHAQELGEWLWGAHWFPHLRHDPAILALAAALPAEWRSGELCDPQILIQFPHVGPEPDISFHRDEEPAWAGGRRYRRIVGVALSPWRAANGGLLVRTPDATLAVELDPGDAVMMDPELWHSGGINRTGGLRYGVYFRWLSGGRSGSPVAARSSESRARRSAPGSGSQT